MAPAGDEDVEPSFVLTPEYEESLLALDDTVETRAVLRALLERARTRPENAPAVPGTEARVLRSRAYANYPPLRLIYGYGGGVVRLYLVEVYDPLAGE